MNMSCQSVEEVLSNLEIIKNTVSLEDNRNTLKILMKNIPDAVNDIFLFRQQTELQCYSNKIKLCSSQMAKTLPSLVKLLSAGTDPALKEINHYLVEKLHWCFNETLRILLGGGSQDDSEPSGLFIKSLDNLTAFCLQSDKNDSSIKPLVEDLLCHALTIAKIADYHDYQEIAAACKNVLTATSDISSAADLKKEPLKKENILCSVAVLERRVNIAVLRLYLNVSCKFAPPLKNIVKKTVKQENDAGKSRQLADIRSEVNMLDQYFERVQLIGNYAVACTDCKKKKLNVQCCLVSLEFLVNYIIPAATSFYMDPNNLVKKRFVHFLTDECMSELEALNGLLDYNIVDTVAFTEVVREDVVDVVSMLKEKYDCSCYNSLDSFELVVKCHKLARHLKATDDPIVKENPTVIDTVKQFLDAVQDYISQTKDGELLGTKELFYTRIDCIVIKIEEILQNLKEDFLPSMTQPSCCNPGDSYQLGTHFEGTSTIAFSECPNRLNNAARSTVAKSCDTPTTPKAIDLGLLDPYLSKIRETPLLRSTVRVKTPYKEVYVNRSLPKQLAFELSDIEDSSA